MSNGVLRVRRPEPAGEIVVRDAALNIVHAAPTSIDHALDEGIYRVDVWTPGATDVHLVAVPSDVVTFLEGTDSLPDSIVPLTDIRSADARHADLATALARRRTRPHADAGTVGGLFLFVRSAGDPRFVPPDVDVLDLGGRPVASLVGDGQVDARHGCAGLALDLDPGLYVLRHRVPGRGNRGQVVQVLARRQTQVFAPWAPDHVDLGAAVICMPALGAGFDPADRNRYLAAEQAVRALSTGRPQQLATFDDPLLELVDRLVPGPGQPVDVADDGAPGLSSAVIRSTGSGQPRDPGPAGLLTAPVDGSVWARWDLDRAPLPVAVPSGAGPRPADPPTGAPSRPRSALAVLVDDAPVGLAAAGDVVVRFGRGRHIDVGLWLEGRRGEVEPQARLRVRVGLRARLYRTAGPPVRYDGVEVPLAPTEAVGMSIRSGQALLEHLDQHLDVGPGTP